MAHWVKESPITLLAGAAIGRYAAVVMSADNTCSVAAGNTVPIVGFAMNEASSAGDAVQVQTGGIAKAVVGTGGVAFGDRVTAEAISAGEVVVVAADHQNYIGIVTEGGAAGEICSVLIQGGHESTGA